MGDYDKYHMDREWVSSLESTYNSLTGTLKNHQALINISC